jgi:hypothetical protein
MHCDPGLNTSHFITYHTSKDGDRVGTIEARIKKDSDPKAMNPSKYPVSSDVEVPGACAPIKTVYHLAQAMSWIAQHRPTIEDSDAQLDDIPRLLKPFLAKAGLFPS